MSRGKRTVILSSFFFVASASVSWIVFGAVTPQIRYVATAFQPDAATAADLALFASKTAFHCTVEALTVFLSGLSFFPAVGSSAVLAFRGASLGATLRGIRDGAVVIYGGTFIPGFGADAAVPVLYALSSALFIAFSFVAGSFSDKFGRDGAGKAKRVLVYAAVFSVFLGAATALELLRCAAVK